MTRIAYFDCFSGVAGDMTLGALFDAGVPLEVVTTPLGKLPLEPFEIEAQRTERLGLSAIQVRIRCPETGVFRTYASVRAMLEGADLPAWTKRNALEAYRKLAEAEARVHGKDVAHVAFHELGSVDTVVDIVGSFLALEYFGVEQVRSSPVATGMGMVRTEHGVFPVPAPAVVELLKGAPLYSRGIPTELTTPTGAAILAGGGATFGDLPTIRVDAVGYGAGTRELEIPNVLRLIIGEEMTEEAGARALAATVIEANIDDMNPELYEHIFDRLFEAGAQDVWITPIVMKRGRPAATLNVMCSPPDERTIRDVIFAETTTLGLRRRSVEKWALPREVVAVDVEGGTVRVKVSKSAGRVVGMAPEYADCVAIARETRRALKDVYAEAAAAARLLLSGDS